MCSQLSLTQDLASPLCTALAPECLVAYETGLVDLKLACDFEGAGDVGLACSTIGNAMEETFLDFVQYVVFSARLGDGREASVTRTIRNDERPEAVINFSAISGSPNH